MKRFFTLMAVPLMFCGPLARADDFCTQLNKVLADASHSFSNIRGSKFDFGADEYEGAVTLGAFNDCATDSGSDVAEYRCSSPQIADSETQAKDKFDRAVLDVKDCFGKDVLPMRQLSENKLIFRYVPTDDRISVRYHRFTKTRDGPYYKVTVTVEYVNTFR